MNPKKIKMLSVAAAFMMSATVGTVLANAESPDSAPLANVVSSAEVEAEMSSYNASSTYTSGDYKYTINSNATIGSSEDENITITITDYTGSDTDLVIPGTIDGYKVTEIGDEAFRECASLKSVVIPEGGYIYWKCCFLGLRKSYKCDNSGKRYIYGRKCF